MGSRGRRAARPTKRALLRRALGSVRIRAALGLGVVLSVSVTGTFAHWSDATAVSGTTFGAGTIDLKVNDSDAVTAYAALSIATLVPGNSVAGLLTVKNTGTAALKYTASSTATNADGKNLRGSLVVKLTGDTAVTGASPFATCAGSTLAGSQTTLNGPLLSTGRQLAAGAGETVCVQVTLDANAPTTLQGATTDVVLTFAGTSDLS